MSTLQISLRRIVVWAWVIFLSGIVVTANASTNPERITPKFADLIETNSFRADLLPFLREGMQTHQFCSYDRAGDNYDAEYFPLYVQPNGECVIFDAMGPGCLYRHHMNIWHNNHIERGINIRYYFDDETKPRIDMDVSTFFSAKNPLGIFQSPLAWDGKERFRVFYHPMFFKKRLKVCLSAVPGGGPIVVQNPWEGSYKTYPVRHNHWYEYTYQLFTNDPGLESWTPERGRQMMPTLLTDWSTHPLGSDPKPTQGDKSDRAEINVESGKTKTLWQSRHAGSIAALHIKIDPPDSEDALANTWLKITFDGADSPQISAPIGNFFGAYRTSLRDSYASLLLGFSNGEGYCYFPMPFWKSATIQIENRSKDKVSIASEIWHRSAANTIYPKDQCGYLFAHFHHEDPRIEGKDYVYLQTSGSGQVVGHVTSRWDTSMEEDERTYFDGSETPAIYGEGFEDDHGMGWGLQNLTLPIFGAIHAKGGSGAVYRFLLPDMYSFASGIHYGHQTYGPHTPLGHEGMYQAGTEESVAFWYGSLKPRLIQTDELDVGNARSESKHGYQAEGNVQRVKGDYWYDGEFNNVLLKTPAIVDDGISFTGSSTFNVAISPDNQGIRLRRRCDKANNRQEAHVYIDGQLVTERPWYSVDYEKTYRNIRWLDSDFEVPEKYTKGKSNISVRIEFAGSLLGRWDEYRYWVYSYLAGK